MKKSKLPTAKAPAKQTKSIGAPLKGPKPGPGKKGK